MFGSKIKTWMENHIGRPRKKANKNKHNVTTDNSCAGTIGPSNIVEQHKQKHAASGFTVYHYDSQCSSPYRTSSNSNASSANHTGCSTSVISSPVRRREVSPIQNHTQSRYGWQSPDREHVISPKSENFLYAPQHHHSQQYLRSHHTAPNTRENSCEDNKIATKFQKQPSQQQQQHQLNCSTSSFSSLSWSTGSKEPSMHSNLGQNSNVTQQTSKDMLLQQQFPHNQSPLDSNSYSPEEQKLSDEDPNAVHYEEIGTLIRHPEKLFSNILNEIERPKSEQCPPISAMMVPPLFSDEKQTQDDASTRYGRLLPSKIQNPTIVSFRTGSEECISRNTNHGQHQNAVQDGYNSTFLNARNGIRHKYRTQIHPNTLSSPESAYSTGYSTDGTSPGTGYTPPEYYVNMRTGTHYFPKSVNSLAIEAQRYKFGLNKIEEMSPIDPLPKTSFGHRANEETEVSLLKQSPQPWLTVTGGNRSPVPIRNTIVIPTLKGFESPSPRQRCRIRTNPWYSTTETSSSSSTVQHSQQLGGSLMNTSQISSAMTISSTSSHSTSALSTMHLEHEHNLRTNSPSLMSTSITSTTKSSTLGSNTAASAAAMSAGFANKSHNNIQSSDSSSSLTEVENLQRSYTPNTMKRKRSLQIHYNIEPVASVTPQKQKTKQQADVAPLAMQSDDDSTLNEMMGKFDESYIYEKETDILSSDSDPTDCPTDLDTGQDAGDECDTDDLLDIDFIDTASIQEVYERKEQINLGKCYYVGESPKMAQRKLSVRSRRSSRSIKISGEQSLLTAAAGSAQRRRKRYHKTRKKSSEGREHCRSPLRKPRETRSVGGTPICLRKNLKSQERQRYSQTTPHQLSHRSSSLVFTDVRESRFMTIAESERALLKADFEADVKYRQLIMEAESILVSMRNSVQSIPRETPAASPRRVNPLANKRVEMIKNCEIDVPKRDAQKQQQQTTTKIKSNDLNEQELTAAVNKRIEILKLEIQSPPGSPKMGSCSPRKTHLTNFINQNIPTEVAMRKSHQNSPLLSRRTSLSPTASPMQQRRVNRSQSPRTARSDRYSQMANLALSDSDQENSMVDQVINQNQLAIKEANDLKNHSIVQVEPRIGPKITLNYCPQSEPLKRKVYKEHTSSYERVKTKYHMEPDPHHIRLNLLRQQRLKSYNTGSSEITTSTLHQQQHLDFNYATTGFKTDKTDTKAALILSTIEDLKRNLEHQSIELNGLNES